MLLFNTNKNVSWAIFALCIFASVPDIVNNTEGLTLTAQSSQQSLVTKAEPATREEIAEEGTIIFAQSLESLGVDVAFVDSDSDISDFVQAMNTGLDEIPPIEGGPDDYSLDVTAEAIADIAEFLRIEYDVFPKFQNHFDEDYEVFLEFLWRCAKGDRANAKAWLAQTLGERQVIAAQLAAEMRQKRKQEKEIHDCIAKETRLRDAAFSEIRSGKVQTKDQFASNKHINAYLASLSGQENINAKHVLGNLFQRVRGAQNY